MGETADVEEMPPCARAMMAGLADLSKTFRAAEAEDADHERTEVPA